MHTIKLFCLTAVLFIISACVSNYRQCPAYNLEDENQWIPGSNGTTYRFISSAGDVQEYKLDVYYMNETYKGRSIHGGVKSENIACFLERRVKLVSVDNSHGFNIAFSTSEKSLGARKNIEDISIAGGPYVKTGEKIDKTQQLTASFRLPYRARPPGANARYAQLLKLEYDSDVSINEKTYTDVVTLIPESTKQIPYFVSRLVLSRGHGLIQFERRDGTVFNLESIKP